MTYRKLVSAALFGLAACGGAPAQKSATPPSGPPSVQGADPKSGDAAKDVVERYFALIAARDYAHAYRLWGGQGEAAGKSFGDFRTGFSAVHDIRVDSGPPGEAEGAAGSIYITVPVHVTGHMSDGGAFDKRGTFSLRRVNDVPGSTEAQRRWHIHSSDLDL